MGIKRPRKSPGLLYPRHLQNTVEAAETTPIPIDGIAGHLGAAMYFAVLCYPGTDSVSHGRRNRLVTALFEYIRGIIKYSKGYTRVSSRRAAATESRWLQKPAQMKNHTVFAVGTRAEKILREQRLPCAWIASQLAGVQISEHLKSRKSGLQIKIGGPQRLTGLIESAAETLGLQEPRTMWRYWHATLPVLHLATAFYFLQPKQKTDDRKELLIRCIRDHRLWLAKAVESAESRAKNQLPFFTTFDPSKRICLLPQ